MRFELGGLVVGSRLVAVLGAVAVVGLAGVGAGPAQAFDDRSRPGPAPSVVRDRLEQAAASMPEELVLDRLAAPGYRILRGVNAEARDEVFAVGLGGTDRELRARRFDGERWALDTPPGDPPGDLRSVTPVLADGTGWAVGGSRAQTLAVRWDGERWEHVPTPVPEIGHIEYLESVDAVGPDDIWAVGVTETDPPVGNSLPLALHWDGEEWSRVEVPMPFGNDSGSLTGVTALSADDVWVAGDSIGVQEQPLLVHWDGSEWTPYARPLEDSIYLRAIDGVASDDIWAVGSNSQPPREWGLLHWNGRRWREFHAPVPPGDWIGFSMYGVSALGPDNVWAVGGYGRFPNTDHAQILRWDGRKWRRVKSPQPGSHENTLYGVSGSGANDVYAVGTFADTDDPGTHHLIEHWDGNRWTRVHPGRDR